MARKITLQLWLMLVAMPFAFAQSGTLVPSFGENGIKQIDFGQVGTDDDWGEVVKTDAEGKIWIAGSLSGNFGIVRLNMDGSIDSTFSDDGKLQIPAGYNARAYGLALGDNGKILLAGRSDFGDFSVVQLNSDGTPDSSFSDDGKILIPAKSGSYNEEESLGFIVDQEGKTLIAGGSQTGSYNGNRDFIVVRLNTDGSMDSTFASNGELLVPDDSSTDVAYTMALDNNNRILVAGSSTVGIEIQGYEFHVGRMSVIRLDNSGNLDTTFDKDGKLILDIGGDEFSGKDAKSLAVDENGKILIAGTDRNNNVSEFIILRLNDNGSFDNTFSDDGIDRISVGNNYDIAYSLILDKNNRIVLAGNSYTETGPQDYSVIRLKTDGTLDSTFSDDGKLIFPIGVSDDQARSVTLDENGKLLIAGLSYNGKNYDFSAARVNDDGNLDSTFDEDGKVMIHSNGIDEAKSMVIDSDGKVLAAGFSYTGSDNDFSIVRLNADGSLDKTFNHSGKLTIPVGDGDDVANCIALDASGKILVAGRSVHDGQGTFSIVRLLTDGIIDTLFDADGKLSVAVGNYDDGATAMSVDSFGRILMVGISDGHFSLLRLNSDGSLDNAFDGDGKKELTEGYSAMEICMAIDADGKILMAGRSQACSGHECGWQNFQIFRINTDGSYDSTFEGNGKLMLPFDDPQVKYYINVTKSIDIDSTGKIILMGSTAREDNIWSNDHWGFGITRLNPDGSLDTTFNTNGKPLIPFTDLPLEMSDSHLYTNSKLLIGGSIKENFGIFRMTMDERLDSTFGDNGLRIPTHGSNYSMKADSNYIWMAGSDEGDYKIVKLYARNNQHIDFNLPDTVQYGDPPIKMVGTASSGLPVAYTSSNSSIAFLAHDTLNISGPGTITITAKQGGDGSFYAADPVSRNLAVKSNITGIPTRELEKEIKVYPNPVSNILYLESPGIIKSVVLTGVEGNVIYRNIMIYDNQLVIDLSEFNPGCYLITVQLDDNAPSIVRKIIKL
jgi:uncharacterized delta-60 repeat protein